MVKSISIVEWYIKGNDGDRLVVFTDASKSVDNKVGAVFVIPKYKISKRERLNNNLAVYTAELVVILIALSWVESNRPKRVAIASDSSSALLSIQNGASQSRQDIILDILQLVHRCILGVICIVLV